MTKRKQEQLNELNDRMMKCNQCILRETCRVVVPGEGNAEAEIMFIGEGPGQREDELGRPFVGAAGKFLDELLETIDIKREDTYIANIIKCRPPGNRDPLPEEVEACWSWLVEQIKIIDPKLIVLLGKHAMERFLPNQKISQIHGKALRRNIPEIGTWVFYALYHPAAALYNGGMRSVLIEDFKKIPKVLEMAKKPEENPAVENMKIEPEEDKQERLF
ncbi:MAG: uracil-DNA glycosylase [Candidatus Moranbacteria bacterium]|nr:uracil-DNA glycosylase [Candidatus Moranbacteria bacterium]